MKERERERRVRRRGAGNGHGTSAVLEFGFLVELVHHAGDDIAGTKPHRFVVGVGGLEQMSNELQKEALACRALLLIWRSNEMNHEFAKALDGRLAFPHDQQPINMLDEFFRKSLTIVLLQLETSLPSSLVCCHRSLACFENLCERRLAAGHGRSPTLGASCPPRSKSECVR